MNNALVRGRKKTLLKLAIAAIAKLLAAVSAFVLTLLVTRNMSTDSAGLFLLGFSLLAVCSIFFRLGLDNALLRFLSAHGVDEFAQEKLNRGLIWVFAVTIPAALVGMVFCEQISLYVFNKPQFADVLFWMMPALPSMALFFLFAIAFQSQHKVMLGVFFQKLGISALFVVGFSASLALYSPPSIPIHAARIYSGSAIIVLVLGIYFWYRQKGVGFRFVGFADAELTKASMNLWGIACMGLAVQWSGLLFAGAFVGADEFAYLSAALRTANLTSFVLVVVNMVVAPRFAQMWSAGDLKALERLAKLSVRGMTLVVVPVAILVCFFSEYVMSVFGKEYAAGARLLVLLTIGQTVNVITGSVGYLLTMSGHEEAFRKLTIWLGVATLIVTPILAFCFGVVGAAVATAIAISVKNIFALVLVKKKLGFTPIG